ncbi:MAG TPA: carboxypeptidase-like regulatory domain-containing protein, partial [Chitinophagaceae bacterium]
MRLTTVLIIISTLTISARSDAQKVSLSLENAPLESAFSQIRQQTGCSFLWNEHTLQDLPPMSVSVHGASLEEAVKACLKDLPLTYEIHGKVVYIERKPGPDKINNHVDRLAFKVSGIVTDSTGNPLIGVSVKVKGTRSGTVTDAVGHFEIEAPA